MNPRKLASWLVDSVLRRYPAALHQRCTRYFYSRFPKNHVFHIAIDDVRYDMTFGDYPLDDAIIERIQGNRELQTQALYAALTPPGGRVLEIGSCYGEFTVLISRYLGRDGRLMAIEGVPNNFALLERNLRLNSISNVIAKNLFVSNAPGSIAFDTSERAPYQAMERLKSGDAAAPRGASVPLARVSDVLAEANFIPDCIFMDIEGFEVDVIENLNDGWLSKHKPTIMFEIHETFYSRGRDLGYITRMLGSYGYTLRMKAGNMICFPPN